MLRDDSILLGIIIHSLIICSTNTEKEILKHEFKFNLRGSCLDECEINQPTTEFHSGEQILGATDQKHGSKDLPTCATYGDFKG